MMDEFKSPHHARLLLRKIYGDDLSDEIIGDFEEVFVRRVREEGVVSARLKYWRDVVLSTRNLGLKERKRGSWSQSLSMITNYVTVSLRMMRRNPTSSLISILGLSTAIGCTIVAFLWVDYQSHLDTFHERGDRIYQVITRQIEGDDLVRKGGSPFLLSRSMREDQAGVESAASVKMVAGHLRVGTQVHTEKVMFTDPSFLEIFDFPMQAGVRQTLYDQSHMVLSEEMAKKYFGDTDPMNRTVSIKFADNKVQQYVVGGIFASMPANASFKPQVVIPMANYERLKTESLSWSDWCEATFVLTEPKSLPDQWAGLLDQVRQAYNEQNTLAPIEAFESISLKELASESDNLQDPLARGEERSDYLSLLLTAVLMLVLACSNYMNVAVTSGTKRLREVAIRKTMGGSRSSIVGQFLTEHLVLSGLGLLAGVLLSYWLLLPGFNYLAPVDVPFAFSSWAVAIGFFIVLWLFVTLVAGAYPAFYIVRFQPSTILAGKQKFGARNYLSKILMTLQLFLSFTMVIGSLVFTDNALFVKELSWGYEPDNVLSIRLPDPAHYELMASFLTDHEDVIDFGGSSGHIGVANRSREFSYLSHQFRILSYDVSPDYLETLGVELSEGSFFEEQAGTNQDKIMVNQAFAEKMNWTAPVGQQIRLEDRLVTVIGVIGNIRHAFFSVDDVRPMLFTSSDRQRYDFLTIRYHAEALLALDQSVEQRFRNIAPDDPYERIYQSQVFNRWYDNVDANIGLMSAIGAIAIFLTCLGLYGLIGYRLQVRLKELAIRKTMGAGRSSLVKAIFSEYRWILLISIGIGAPLGTWGIHGAVVQLFSVSKPFSVWPVLLAVALTVTAIAFTIAHELRRTLKVNPADILRDD